MFISEAYAAAAGSSGGIGGLSSTVVQFLPILLIFVIMYFLLLRPQQQKQRQHRDMVANLRRGDTVVTTGGIIGKVAKVDENEVQVEIADGVRVKVVRAMVAEVRSRGEPVKEPG